MSVEGQAGVLDAGQGCELGRVSRGVLAAAEPLLLDQTCELAVDEQRGTRVMTEAARETKNSQRASPLAQRDVKVLDIAESRDRESMAGIDRE